MASIRENKKNGKTVSYRFTACLERDVHGRQIRRYSTWIPPEELTPSKVRKAAERAANAWEEKIRKEYQKGRDAVAEGRSYTVPPEHRRDDFVSFVDDIWFSLYICNGDRKSTTTAFYEDIARYITSYFKGAVLQDITPMLIQQYLQYLRAEHEERTGKPLSANYLHHQFGVLKNIFGYAEKMISLQKIR